MFPMRILGLGLAALLAVNGFKARAVEILEHCELPRISLLNLGAQPFTAADLARARRNGLKYDDLPSLGSGVAQLSDTEFVGLSDRGPNGEANGRRTFPLPKFSPYLTRFRIRAGRMEILATQLLTDSRGVPLSGLSNQAGDERLFESVSAAAPLPYDPNGVDPEAVRVFPDGKFLLAEEYGPSVLVVSSNGQVLMRYVPVNKPLAGATYPVQAILPAVLAERRPNRGFEALALAPDGRTAYVMLQSPVGRAADGKLKSARVSRALRLDLHDPLKARVTGHFLLPLSSVTNYSASLQPADVKLNDAEWLAPDQLLVLEQAGETARLLIADFRAAGDLATHPAAYSTEPEALGDDLEHLPVAPVRMQGWASLSGLSAIPTKLEGLAIMSPTEVVVVNDNDFGLGGGAPTPSQLWRIRLDRALPLVR